MRQTSAYLKEEEGRKEKERENRIQGMRTVTTNCKSLHLMRARKICPVVRRMILRKG